MSNKIETWAYDINTLRILAADYYVQQDLSEIGYESLEEALTDLNELAVTDLRRFPGDLYIIIGDVQESSTDLHGLPFTGASLRFETFESWKTHLNDKDFRETIPNPFNIRTPNLCYYSSSIPGSNDEYRNSIMVVPESYEIYPHWRLEK